MWSRLLRIFSTGLNAWRFSANPLQFVFSLLLIILAPYLIYLFWGTVLFFGVMAVGGWALYRYYQKRKRPF